MVLLRIILLLQLTLTICLDVDECNASPRPCSPSANCTNTPGSYECTCLPGYEGNGTYCEDVDECNASPRPCSPSANCTNTPGSYECTCLPGYEGNGTYCEAPCSLKSEHGPCNNNSVYWFFDTGYGGCSRFWYGGCEGNGNRFPTKEECEDTCVSPPPKDACKLPPSKGACDSHYRNWYYDSEREACTYFDYGGCLGNNNNFKTREACQKQCEPEKTTDNDECYGDCYCTNNNGSSSCECRQGYKKNATGWCEDINECQLNISDCEKGEQCWNTDGSFKCCPNGTILDKNGNCACPEQHLYYQNQGCVYNQCLNTSCGLGAECKMICTEAYCFCPNGSIGNPHEECALLAEPDSSESNSFEPSIQISLFVKKTDKRLKHFTSSDELILDKKFRISVSARDVNFTKPEKRIVCQNLNKPTEVHVNQTLEFATDSEYVAKVPEAVSSMNGSWACLITGSTVFRTIGTTFPVAIKKKPFIVTIDE